MKTQLIFCRAQKLTRELQHVLGEDPPKPTTASSRTRTNSASDTLEATFEWDRVRRSAAPSPELLPGDEFHKLEMHPDSSELGESYSGEGEGANPSISQQTGSVVGVKRESG